MKQRIRNILLEAFDTPSVLYHTTSKKHRQSISKYGLLPQKSEIGSAVYASDKKKDDNSQYYDIWEINTKGLRFQKDSTTEPFGDEKWYETHEVVPPENLRLIPAKEQW